MDAPLLNPYRDLHALLHGSDEALVLAARKKLIWAYAWAVPSDEAIRTVAELSPVVEWGAGTGYWAWLLAQAGARVRAFDRDPPAPPRWCAIERADLETLRTLRDHALLLVWPPLDEPMAEIALRAYGGEQVIYVGEWRGRTGDGAFHDALERDWRVEREIAIPTWPGFDDRLRILRRRQDGLIPEA